MIKICEDRTDVVFLILDVGLMIENSTVFQAQVVDQIIALRKLGYSVSVLCAFEDRTKFQLVAGNKLDDYQVPVVLVVNRGLFRNIFSFVIAIRNLKRSTEIGQIYIRGFWAAFPILLAAPLRRLSYVYDVRGDTIDESAARGRAPYRLFFIRKFETFALRHARFVTCVSKRLASIIQERACLEQLPEVIPSCIDMIDFSYNEDVRASKRSELGYSDKNIVLVYSGGLAQYQMIAEMLALWRGVFPLNNDIEFLLLINSDPPSLERSVGSLDDFGCRLKILNLPRSEVFATLSAGDIGFLLREERTLNATASPVKFAEYLAAGLAVVSSPGVGDLSERIIKRQLGVLVKPSKETPEVKVLSDFIHKLEIDHKSFRDNALSTARDTYSWDAYKDTYQKLYAPS